VSDFAHGWHGRTGATESQRTEKRTEIWREGGRRGGGRFITVAVQMVAIGMIFPPRFLLF